jgi:hypothetical protein
MRRATFIFVFAWLVACVPASEPRPPAGAGGFVVEPSPAARGEPFESDGWTLTVEKLVIRADVGIMQTNPSGCGYAGSGEPYLFDGRKRAEIFHPAVSVGPICVNLVLTGRHFSSDGTSYDVDPTVIGVDPADVGRFGAPSDQGSSSGPSMLLVVRGQRGAARARLDLALDVTKGLGWVSKNLSLNNLSSTVEIRANELALAKLDVTPELVFSGDFRFETIASADADSDGVVTADELRKLLLPTNDHGIDTEASTFLDALTLRLATTLFHAHPR